MELNLILISSYQKNGSKCSRTYDINYFSILLQHIEMLN